MVTVTGVISRVACCPLAMLLAAAAALLLLGCSGDDGLPKKQCFPAKGKLLIKSQPAAGAIVIFQPQSGAESAEWWAGYPRAHVGPDGSFELETYGEKDGAPAGEYVVLVTWPAASAEASGEEGSAVDKLQGKYADPASSKLKAKIEAAPTEIPPLTLP